MSLNVEEILRKADEEKQKALESVSVDKPVELFVDLGHLVAFDPNVIDAKEFKANKEDYLKQLARDNTQLVVNKLFDLDRIEEDGVTLVTLPAPSYRLPRAKPCPRAKPPTKWEQFAKDKGIQKKKKEKLVWDEVSKDWKPRFGYHGMNQNSDQWVIEVPENADPDTDFFSKQSEDKKERVAKNELQRLRNIARSSKLKLPGTAGIVPNVDLNKDQLAKARVLAKESTASLGKFTENLADEKPAKNLGVKRKFQPNLGDMKAEKDRNLELVSQILSKQVQKIDDAEEDKVLNKTKQLKRGKKRTTRDADDDNEDIGDRYDQKNRVKKAPRPPSRGAAAGSRGGGGARPGGKPSRGRGGGKPSPGGRGGGPGRGRSGGKPSPGGRGGGPGRGRSGAKPSRAGGAGRGRPARGRGKR